MKMKMMMSRKALEEYGLVNLGNINWNLSPPVLVEHALARKEAMLASNGVLAATTGTHTGRSPKDKFIVSNEEYAAKIWWGENNYPISRENFDAVRSSLSAYLQGRDVYVLDAAAGADPAYRMPIQVITALAWHNLFARQLFLRSNESDLSSTRPGFTILCVPHFHTDPRVLGTRSETAIIVDFEERLVLIAGTEYAGEMKKSIFTVLNFILPAEGVLSMHCSANVGPEGDVAVFLGLSGTGGHPKAVIFLTADSFGVLPPISKLTTAQAMYYFLSGYTSKLAGTEAGVTTPQATFSSCFGAAFLPLRPGEYANLLRERIEKHNVRCYLVNTGWTGGPYGIGERININYTRAMVRAAIDGALENVELVTDPIFGLHSPTSCPDVPDSLLIPRNTWEDKEAYDRQAADLAARFKKNFQQFTLPSDEVRNAGPK